MLGRCRESDDVRAVVGKHRLAPGDAQLQLRVGEPDSHQNVHHPRPIVVVVDGRDVLVKRLDCHGLTLGDRRAGSLVKLCVIQEFS